MGATESKVSHSDNDFELVIRCSKELEHILEKHFQATGKGLHEKITSASGLPAELIRDMRYLATLRNKLVHEHGFNAIPDRSTFILRFERSEQNLNSILQERQRRLQAATQRRNTNDGACIIS